MQVSELSGALKPFKVINDRNALSTAYKTVRLSGEYAYAASTYGFLRMKIPATGFKEPVCVDTTALLGVVNSLPGNADLDLDVKGGAVAWASYANAKANEPHAHGRMACVQVDTMPEMPPFPKAPEADIYEPDSAFLSALELGALSCQQPSLSTAGLYGVLLDNREKFRIGSTDNVTLSLATLKDTPDMLPELLTLPPDGVRLLCEVIDPEASSMYFSDNGTVYCWDDSSFAVIKKQAPLQFDLAEIYKNFLEVEHIVPLDNDRISAFIRRVLALGENRNSAVVNLGAEAGQLKLVFDEGTASSTEYFLLKEADIPDCAPRPIKATTLSRVLSKADSLALDHAERQILVFLGGDDPDFKYIISTKVE